jgi:hypothetical protein
MASSTPPPSAVSKAASCERTGPVAAATQALAASGSAVSIDLVPNATTGTSMAALQPRPSLSGVPPSPAPAATSATYAITGKIQRWDRSRIAAW